MRPTTAVHHGGNSLHFDREAVECTVHSGELGEDSKQSDTVYLFGAYAVELRRATPFFPQ